MRTSTTLAILALVFSLISCGPPAEEIARTIVAATDESDSAVALELQQSQTVQPAETQLDTRLKYLDFYTLMDE